MASALRSALAAAAPLRFLRGRPDARALTRRAVVHATPRWSCFATSIANQGSASPDDGDAPSTSGGGKKIVLVTGATGRVGKEVVARLAREDGFVVRAATRDKAEYATSLGAHETTPFDLEDRSTWGPAMAGVTHLFSSTQDKFVAQHLEFVKWIGESPEVQSRLEHVVRISCFGADTNTNAYDPEVHASRANAGIPLMLQHYWWAEACFVDAGLQHKLTSIRGNFYMNHLLKNELDAIAARGVFSSPLGACKNSFVSCNDMGEAAVAVLVQGAGRHGDKYYDVTGSQSTSMEEVAAILTRALATPLAREVAPGAAGRTVTYEAQDLVAFEEDFGATRAEFFEYLRNGFYTRCSPDFYNITGKKPLTYFEYLTTQGAAGDTGLAELFSAQGAIFTKGVDEFKDLKKVQK